MKNLIRVANYLETKYAFDANEYGEVLASASGSLSSAKEKLEAAAKMLQDDGDPGTDIQHLADVVGKIIDTLSKEKALRDVAEGYQSDYEREF